MDCWLENVLKSDFKKLHCLTMLSIDTKFIHEIVKQVVQYKETTIELIGTVEVENIKNKNFRRTKLTQL